MIPCSFKFSMHKSSEKSATKIRTKRTAAVHASALSLPSLLLFYLTNLFLTEPTIPWPPAGLRLQPSARHTWHSPPAPQYVHRRQSWSFNESPSPHTFSGFIETCRDKQHDKFRNIEINFNTLSWTPSDSIGSVNWLPTKGREGSVQVLVAHRAHVIMGIRNSQRRSTFLLGLGLQVRRRHPHVCMPPLLISMLLT